jgi:hypothetical protein
MSLRALYLEGIRDGRDMTDHPGRPDPPDPSDPPDPPGTPIAIGPVCGIRDARGDACLKAPGHAEGHGQTEDGRAR